MIARRCPRSKSRHFLAGSRNFGGKRGSLRWKQAGEGGALGRVPYAPLLPPTRRVREPAPVGHLEMRPDAGRGGGGAGATRGAAAVASSASGLDHLPTRRGVGVTVVQVGAREHTAKGEMRPVLSSVAPCSGSWLGGGEAVLAGGGAWVWGMQSAPAGARGWGTSRQDRSGRVRGARRSRTVWRALGVVVGTGRRRRPATGG